MTLKELSQLYYLNREIEIDQQRIDELRTKAANPSAGQLTGMPQNPTIESKLERYIAEIVDLSVIISTKQQRCVHERNRLERYINDIPDSLTRQIFALRFINGLSWWQVSEHIGGNSTDQTVKKRCYRYLESEKV